MAVASAAFGCRGGPCPAGGGRRPLFRERMSLCGAAAELLLAWAGCRCGSVSVAPAFLSGRNRDTWGGQTGSPSAHSPPVCGCSCHLIERLVLDHKRRLS